VAADKAVVAGVGHVAVNGSLALEEAESARKEESLFQMSKSVCENKEKGFRKIWRLDLLM
jgi:hypothetical protein